MPHEITEDLYSRLFADHPSPIWVYDPATLNFLDVNNEALREYGYSREEFLTLTLDAIRPAEDLAASHDRIKDISRSSRERTWKHVRKDGSFLWVEITAKDIHYVKAGARLSVIHVVTDRKLAEDKLKQSERDFRTLAENSIDIVVRYDTNAVVLYTNPAFEKFLGVPLSVLQGKKFSDSPRPPRMIEFITRAIRTVVTDKQPCEFDFDVDTVDGRRYYHIRFAPEVDDDGEVVSVLAIGRDINDRKIAENSLKASEVMHRTLFDGSRDSLVIINQDNDVYDINKCGLELLRQNYSDVIGKPVANVLNASVCTEIIDYLAARNFESGEIRHSHCVGQGGATIYLDYSVVTEFIPGYHLLRLRDITESKLLEAQSLRQEKLIALGQLVDGVAHEINNPLAAISGTVQLMQTHEDGQVREDALTVLTMTNRIVQIVRGLITFANPESLERTHIDMNDVVQSALESSSSNLAALNVTVDLDKSETAAVVNVNYNQIGILLMNLFSNAEHSMRTMAPSQRLLSVSTHIGKSKGWDYVEVIVDDSGNGIEPDAVERIFNPFYTTKDVGEGTGLGLSICHAIVTAHDGTMGVTPKATPGTRMVVRLPLVA